MRWFKHVSNSHNDEKLVLILDEFGPEGYGVWWLLIETIAKEMDKSDKCSLTYPMAKWAKCLCCSKKKAAQFLKRFSEIPENSEKKLIFLEYHGETFVGNLEVKVPNLLKYRDEYCKKSGQAPDKLPRVSGAKIEIETQIESKEETTTRTRSEEIFAAVFEEKEARVRELFPHADFEAEKETCIAYYKPYPPPSDAWVLVLKWFQRIPKSPPPNGGVSPPRRNKGMTAEQLRAWEES